RALKMNRVRVCARQALDDFADGGWRVLRVGEGPGAGAGGGTKEGKCNRAQGNAAAPRGLAAIGGRFRQG
ncbi:MAG: hypothetical protein KGQ57_16145, partial [Burkholderiales bacterium]|nr:hypothetical protein [Burkholderiales bacterium]